MPLDYKYLVTDQEKIKIIHKNHQYSSNSKMAQDSLKRMEFADLDFQPKPKEIVPHPQKARKIVEPLKKIYGAARFEKSQSTLESSNYSSQKYYSTSTKPRSSKNSSPQ